MQVKYEDYNTYFEKINKQLDKCFEIVAATGELIKEITTIQTNFNLVIATGGRNPRDFEILKKLY